MIRFARPEDAAEMAAIYAPFVRDTHTSFELEPPDAAEMARRLLQALPAYPWLVWEEGGEVLGYAYAGPHRARAAYQWCTETTVYLRDDARGRGLGKRLYLALLQILERQGFRMAYAGIALPNDASVALHRSAGFQEVGTYAAAGFKLGRWHDVAWFQRRVGNLDPEPTSPRALTPGELVSVWT